MYPFSLSSPRAEKEPPTTARITSTPAIRGPPHQSPNPESSLTFWTSPSSGSDYIKITVSHPTSEQETAHTLVPGGKLPIPTITDVASRLLDGAVKLLKQLIGESGSETHEVEQDKLFMEKKEWIHDLELQLNRPRHRKTMGELGSAGEEATFNSQQVRAADLKPKPADFIEN
ncbi:hypothetical protein Gorai_011623 [Gossypium raimondii]|uniref:Uncharacterized protein n=1 Tax=Gossypium raimondii TaxID=29730 RepID=A0A7J8PZN2_GOSRA|nr:hypothetical protein [Gossypium raimondii]